MIKKLSYTGMSLLAVSLMMHAGVAQSGGNKDGISNNVIKIGVLTDMSGIYALNGGSDAAIAARMAIEDFGKTNINGAKIEIVTADDQNRKDVAASRVKSWIENDKVDMVTGFVAATAAVGAMEEGAKHKIPVLVASASSTEITNENCNPYTVQWMQDTYGVSSGTVKELVKNNKKSWFFITADYSFGYALEKDATGLIKEAGGEIRGSVKAPFPSADFTEQLELAKKSGAQVIAFAAAGLDAVAATKQAVLMGLDQKQLIVPLFLFHQDVQTLGPQVLKDKYMTTGYVWTQSKESIEFAKKFYGKTHRMPDVSHAGVYSAVLQYLKAVEATGTDNGDEIMNYLKDPRHKINDAIIKNGYIRADGKLMKSMYLIRLKKANEMKNEWDYYEIMKEIPAEENAIPLERSRCPMIKK